jgi:hypothetical protein
VGTALRAFAHPTLAGDSVVFAMYFSHEVLEKIQTEYASLHQRYATLMFNYHNRKYRFPLSLEYAQHGFMRRLGSLIRCIENAFRILPPDRGDDPPTRNERIDATINVQSFVINTFGAIDNLAWIWVTETQLTKEDGSPIPSNWVGFGPKNKFVRQSLSEGFRTHLDAMNGWFGNLESFRHSLAHRIPLYIPPYIVSPNDEKRWRSLEAAIFEASFRGDVALEKRLEADQNKLGRFRPGIKHSFSEGSRQIVFHAQLIADFMTVEQLAEKLLAELPPAPD